MLALFVTDYPPEETIGGSVRVLYEQCTRLAERNHDIHILTRKENFKNGFNIPDNLKIWKYTTNIQNHCSLFLSTLKNSLALFEVLAQKYKYDVINFHQPFSALGVLKSPKNTSVKNIYTCHSLSFEEYWSRNGNAHQGIKYPLNLVNGYLRKKIEKYVLLKSDKVVVLSEYTKNKISSAHKVPGNKCIIMPGGVDIGRFHPSNNKIDLRAKLNLPKNKIVLFTVRNLVNRMGLANLIKALKYVVKENPDIHLIMGGEGPLKARLKCLTEESGLTDYISFAGFVSEEQLPEYYQAADIFVLPTKELEGFGLVTLEALASGLPVLGTSIGGTKEILGQFDDSFIFDDTGPDSLSKKIIEKCNIIKENPLKWKAISSRCRTFVERHYSWEKNIDTLEELFLMPLQN
jgi:glycosyltransferase involved in cell wall biosynthesis